MFHIFFRLSKIFFGRKLFARQKFVYIDVQHLTERRQICYVRHPVPGLNVLLKTPGNAEILAKAAPFTAEYPLPERGIRYYLCQNRTCGQPAGSIREIEARLEALASRKENR